MESKLDACCGVLSSKADAITSDLDACCFTLNSKVDAVQSSLNACCATVNSKADDIASKLDDCCLSLNSKSDVVESKLDACCGVLNSKADAVASDLDACCFTLNSKVDVVQSSIDACCSTLNSKVDEVFVDFRATWTILEDLQTTLGSRIDQVDVDVQAGFAGTFTALNNCCYTLNSKIDALENACAAQPITSPTIINVSGSYCLNKNLSVTGIDAIVINADNVVLDLNGYTIANSASGDGVVVNGSANIIIKNGFIVGNPGTVGNAIGLLAASNNVIITNVNMSGFATGVFGNLVNKIQIEKCTLINNNLSGVSLGGASCCKIVDCQAFDNSATSTLQGAFNITDSSDISLENCFACSNNGSGFQIQNVSHSSNAIYLVQCTSENNGENGFYMTSPGDDSMSMIMQQCTALNNGATGFLDSAAGGSRMYLSNVACGNTPNFTGVLQAPVNGPANARGADNIDCTITGLSPEEIIESKIDACCAALSAQEFTIESKLDACCAALNSKIALLMPI